MMDDFLFNFFCCFELRKAPQASAAFTRDRRRAHGGDLDDAEGVKKEFLRGSSGKMRFGKQGQRRNARA